MRYARALTKALKSGQYAPSLRRACVVVSKWPCVGTFPPWQGAMYDLNNAMSQADTQLRADVWWTLFDDAETHSCSILNGGQRICHLLTPIPGRMSAEQIIAILPEDLRDRWREGTKQRNYGSANDIMDCLDKLEGIAVESSRKRKRGKDTIEELIRALKKDYPDMKLEDSKDILPGLLSQVKK